MYYRIPRIIAHNELDLLELERQVYDAQIETDAVIADIFRVRRA